MRAQLVSIEGNKSKNAKLAKAQGEKFKDIERYLYGDSKTES